MGDQQAVVYRNERGEVSSMQEIWSEKDPMVYMNPEGSATQTNTSAPVNSDRDALLERRKQERLALAREREERRLAERHKQSVEQARERHAQEEKLKQETTQKEREDAKLANLQRSAPVTEMSALQKKIAQLEGFGTPDLDPEIRLFLIRPGQKGKPLTVRRDSPNFAWLVFLDLVCDTCGITDKMEPLCLYSSINGRIMNLESLQSDDIIFVALEKERKDDAIRDEIRKIKKEGEKAELKRKERESKAKEKAQQEAKLILQQREAQIQMLSEAKRKQMQRIQEFEQKTYECEICMDEVTLRELFTVDTCFHRFCRGCMQYHIEAQIESRAFIEAESGVGVICPGNSCENILGIHEVKSCVEPEMFERYDTLLRDTAITRANDMKFCTTPDCGNVLVITPDSPMVVCHTCCGSWCNRCNVPWHGDMKCTEYQRYMVLRRKIERGEILPTDNKSQDWMRAHTKTCPKCKSMIEKNGGCNHMTCGICGHEFCWLCLANYNRGEHFVIGRCGLFS